QMPDAMWYRRGRGRGELGRATGSVLPPCRVRACPLPSALAPPLEHRLELGPGGLPVLGRPRHVEGVLDTVPRDVHLVDRPVGPGEVGVLGEGGPGVLQPGAVAVPVEEAPQLQPPVVDQPLPYLLVQVAEMLVGVVEVGRAVDRDAQEVLAAVGRVVDLTALAVEDDALPVGTRQDDAEPV